MTDLHPTNAELDKIFEAKLIADKNAERDKIFEAKLIADKNAELDKIFEAKLIADQKAAIEFDNPGEPLVVTMDANGKRSDQK